MKEEWKHLDQLAKDDLMNNVSKGIKSYIRPEPTEIIEQFKGNTIMRGRRLCKDLVALLINKQDELNQIVYDFNEVAGRLKEVFPDIPNAFLTLLYCAVLPERYD